MAAVQALYQVAQTGQAASDVLAEFIAHRIGQEIDGDVFVPADITLLTALVRGVDAERPGLDNLVESAIAAPLERQRLELLLRVILAAGAWELSRNVETPAQILLAEYTALTNAFYADAEPGLVNGVLDRLARALRPYEFGAAGAGAIPGGPIGSPLVP